MSTTTARLSSEAALSHHHHHHHHHQSSLDASIKHIFSVVVVVVVLLLLPPLETTSRTSSRTRFLPPLRSLSASPLYRLEISARPRRRARRDTPVRTPSISNRSPLLSRTVETDTRDCCSPSSFALSLKPLEIRRRRPRTRSRRTFETSSWCDNTRSRRRRRRRP